MPGASTPSVRRPDHVGFAVASLDEAIRFWVEGLGAKLVRTGRLDGPFLANVTGARDAEVDLAIVELAGGAVELLQYRGTRPRNGAAPAPFDAGAAHLGLIVDDLDAMVARVGAYGWFAQGIAQVIPAGPRAGTRVMYVVGPDGATIEFMQPPG